MYNDRVLTRENDEAIIIQNQFINKVFGWMAFALLLTGFIAYWIYNTPAVFEIIYSSNIIYGLIIVEFLMVLGLVGLVNRMSPTVAMLVFVLYSVLNGITLSAIFAVYTQASIASTFFITAITFGTMAIYGYFTKQDLTKFGNILFMALIGIVIASVVNIFLGSEMLYWLVTFGGIIVFVGLTAYDTQKLKRMSAEITNENQRKKAAILGALALYLDFINLFLLLLRLFGDRK